MGDRVTFKDAPSFDAVAHFQRYEQIQRSEGEQKNKSNQMLFSGTGGFLAQKLLHEKKDMTRKECADATNQFAKMRFNIGLEKAKRTELENQI